MNRWMRTAFMTAGLSLCAISSASAQATFKIDSSMIPPGLARELKRHGIEVPKEPVRGTVEIRNTARDGLQVRFHETPKAPDAGPQDRADGRAAAPASAEAMPSLPERTGQAGWVDVPPAASAADRCSTAASASRTCPDEPASSDARLATLPNPVTPAPEASAVQPAPRVVVASGPTGEWLVEDGSARIDIQHCGANLCGTVTSAKEKARLGERILRDMKPDGANRWKGTILDPRSGKVYQSTMTLKGNSLRVEGCIMGMLCGGETWKRG